MTLRGAAISLIALSTALIGAPAFAQSLPDLSSISTTQMPPAFTLALDPSEPQPYSTATLSVASGQLDLANATLTVTVNGTNIYSGAVQGLSIPIGAPGVPMTIAATIISQGQPYTQSLEVTPGDVSLVVEPIASAPPLYAGKPLIPMSGQVRLVAIANFRTAAGTPIDPATLSYSWMQDDSVLTDASGIGRSAVIVNAPLQYRSGDFSVTVSTQDGNETGSANVSLVPQDPSVRIYVSDPLLGILFDHALAGNFAIKDTEASFYAAPFSFSTANAAPSINWLLNGAPAADTNTVTLRPTGSGAGDGSLSVTSSEDGLYENAAANLTLSFGAAGTNLFGL